MYQDERKLDFKPLGIAIKKAREAKGWTQEYLAQLVDLTPRSIMYIENRGQHPRLNKFYLIMELSRIVQSKKHPKFLIDYCAVCRLQSL